MLPPGGKAARVLLGGGMPARKWGSRPAQVGWAGVGAVPSGRSSARGNRAAFQTGRSDAQGMASIPWCALPRLSQRVVRFRRQKRSLSTVFLLRGSELSYWGARWAAGSLRLSDRRQEPVAALFRDPAITLSVGRVGRHAVVHLRRRVSTAAEVPFRRFEFREMVRCPGSRCGSLSC